MEIQEEKEFVSRQRERLMARQKRIEKRKRIRLTAAAAGAVTAALLLGIALGMPAARSGDETYRLSEAGPGIDALNGIPVMASILPEEAPGRSREQIYVKYIVIHETGNSGQGANAAAHSAYIQKAASQSKLSWHYTVDEGEIYQHLPDNEMGYHAGDRLVEDGGNKNGIGIEMCVNPENDFEKTLENTAALVSYLMKVYNVPIENVKKHQDFSGKNCPQTLIETGRWEEFLQMVEDAEEEVILRQ